MLPFPFPYSPVLQSCSHHLLPARCSNSKYLSPSPSSFQSFHSHFLAVSYELMKRGGEVPWGEAIELHWNAFLGFPQVSY